MFFPNHRRTRAPSPSTSMSASDGDADAAPSGGVPHAAPSGGVPPPMTPPTLKCRGIADTDDEEDNEKFEVVDVDSEVASTVGKGRKEVAGPGGIWGAAVLRPRAKVRAQPQATGSVERPAMKLRPRPPSHPPAKQRFAIRRPPPPPPPPVVLGSMDLPIGCRTCNECGQAALLEEGAVHE